MACPKAGWPDLGAGASGLNCHSQSPPAAVPAPTAPAAPQQPQALAAAPPLEQPRLVDTPAAGSDAQGVPPGFTADATTPRLTAAAAAAVLTDVFCAMAGYCGGSPEGWPVARGAATNAAAVRLRADLAAGRSTSAELRQLSSGGLQTWDLLAVAPPPSDGAGGAVGSAACSAAGRTADTCSKGGATAPTAARASADTGAREPVAPAPADAAAETRGRFLANMSHELRTPLNGVLATAQLLLSSPLSPEQRELGETILDSCNALLSTLGDILDFSALDASSPGRLSPPLRREPVCLGAALEGALGMVAGAASAKGLQVAALVAPQLWGRHLVGDATRLRQVLHQLLSNAVKFTEAGEVVVEAELIPAAGVGGGAGSAGADSDGGGGGCLGQVAALGVGTPLAHLHPADQAQGQGQGQAVAVNARERLVLRVRDTGIGITRDAMPHLFQCFRQGSDEMARSYGGTGLGLALAQRLAHAMGGRIYVDSELRAGSVFTFELTPEWSEAPAAPAAAWRDGGDGSGCSCVGVSTGGGGGGVRRENSVLSCCSAGCGGGGGGSSAGGSRRGSTEEAPAGFSRSLSSTNLVGTGGEACTAGGGGGCCGGRPRGHPMLQGRVVLVDIGHAATAVQCCQALRQLGMQPVRAHAGGSAGGNDADARGGGAEGGGRADMAVVSPCRVQATLKVGWKGRPVVVLGEAQEVGEKLHPLLAFTPRPLRLAALAASLVKAVSMLSWQDGHAPRLGRQALLEGAGTAAAAAAAALAADGAAGGGGGALGDADGGGGVLGRWWGMDARRQSIDNSALFKRQQRAAAVAVAAAAAMGVVAGQQARRAGSGGWSAPNGVLLPLSGGFAQTASDAAGAEPDEARARVDATGFSAGAELHAASVSAPLPLPLQHHPMAAASQLQQGSAAQQQPPWQQQQQQLPVQTSQQQQVRPTAAPEQQAAPGQQGGEAAAERHPRILVAEDNRVNQKVVLRVLARMLPADCSPDVVENGVEVLRALEKHHYDIILMDIHMPQMDGLEASQRIRDLLPPQRRPTIIALSADTLSALRERCVQAGIADFISKPFRVEDLRRVVANWRSCGGGAVPVAPMPAAQTA